jgi:hypothetical protein
VPGQRQSTAGALGDGSGHGDPVAYRSTFDAVSGIPPSIDGGIASAGMELEWSGERGADADDMVVTTGTLPSDSNLMSSTTTGGTDTLVTRSGDRGDTGAGRVIG